MNNKYPLCLLLLLWMLFSDVFSYPLLTDKRYYFKQLDIENGLSQNTVNTILQDKKGFMWFGTKDGLDRFDGLSFRAFKRDANVKSSLGNNFVTTLYEDTDGLIWVGTDAGLYLYSPEKESFHPFDKLTVQGTRIEQSVTMIQSDKEGNIWIAVELQGLFCYNRLTKKVENYTLKACGNVSTNVKCFWIDTNNTLWIGFFGDGLYYSTDRLQTLMPFVSPEKEEVFKHDVVSTIRQGAYNCLYVSSVKGGLKELNLTSGKVRTLLSTDERGEEVYIRDFIFNSDDELWLGSESGIYIYNLRTNQYTHHVGSEQDAYSLSDNAIYSLYKDREGGIWIGSYFGGINYLPRQYTYFEKFYPQKNENSLHGKRVREFCQGKDGTLWVGTEDGGLNNFNPETKTFRFVEQSSSFTNIHGLCMDGDNLWIGTFSKGLRVMNTRTGVIKAYIKGDTPRSLNDNSVFSICRTAAGDLYLGTLFGLHLYDRQNDDFIRIPELNGKFIYDIKEDSHGNLWLATYANGAYKYDVGSKRWINFLYDEQNAESLPYNKVLSIFEDSHRQIWLTTQGGGFCRYHPESETFTRFTSGDGLPNDVVYQLVEDNDGLFWITTNNGLARFNPLTKEFKVFSLANGLLSNQFNYRSAYKDVSGKIYFGSINGFIAFHPTSFAENKYIPPVAITDFLLFNKQVPVAEEGSPLTRSITLSDSIVLSAAQNSFSLRIAALSYQAPEMNQLMYRLDGFDNEWFTVSETPLITYSNLKHGEYTFRVKASNSDGVWNEEETTLFIHILPPFYLTGWAYCLYVLLLLVSVMGLIVYLKRRSALRHHRQMERFEQEKARELYDAKIDFFTNVAHEIRTPLTLIKGPLENIILKRNVNPEIKEDLNIMSQNTNRLLNLTNQLLDFRKTESKGFSLSFVRCNITEIVQETYLRFTSLSRQKGLEFTIQLSDGDFYAHVDREAFTKILSNLFNNAVKYSDTYIHVVLEQPSADNEHSFCVRVTNDGVLIPTDMREEIFRPFIQLNATQSKQVSVGTGIGLALARSLAELHQGSLKMDDAVDVNCFCLTLPSVQSATISLDADPLAASITQELFPESAAKARGDGTTPVVLVVEDNPEMLLFIVKQLSATYVVLTATNGVEALKVMDAHFVNLVVSDVMMPHMNGFELCKTVKQNVNYSHIPIVLLTAKTNLQSKIEGLELGADAYLDKPFSVEYLLASVANLIHNREKLREAFAKSPFIAANTMAMTKADEEFLRNLNEIIQNNLSNPDFSMEHMADTLNMSRSSFYRKIKGVLDLTPNDYLRLERLKKAAQLLKEGESRVNEICYMVGFNSPSYFAKCFLKQFGVLPKDFAG